MTEENQTLQLLKEMREEVRELSGMREEVRDRFDQVDERFSQVDSELEGAKAERAEMRIQLADAKLERSQLRKRVVDSEMRLATELIAVTGAIEETKGLVLQQAAIRLTVRDHERRLRKLERE